MKKFILVLLISVICAFTTPAFSQTVVDERIVNEPAIIMMNSKTCVYCYKFLTEAMPKWQAFQSYEKQKFNLTIPNLYIIIVPPAQEYPKWWLDAVKEKRAKIPKLYPTFYLWDGNKVVDEFEGYAGEQTFAQFHFMIEKYKNGS